MLWVLLGYHDGLAWLNNMGLLKSTWVVIRHHHYYYYYYPHHLRLLHNHLQQQQQQLQPLHDSVLIIIKVSSTSSYWLVLYSDSQSHYSVAATFDTVTELQRKFLPIKWWVQSRSMLEAVSNISTYIMCNMLSCYTTSSKGFIDSPVCTGTLNKFQIKNSNRKSNWSGWNDREFAPIFHSAVFH